MTSKTGVVTSKTGVMTSTTGVMTSKTVGIVRAGVGVVWLVKLAYEPLSFYADLPRSMLAAPGFLRLVPDRVWSTVLTHGFLTGFKGALLALVVLFTLGVKPYRPIAVLAAVALTFHEGLVRGLTFVNHQELALLYCTIVLALLPSRRHATPETDRAAMTLMALVALLPYTFIAAHRLAFSAPKIFTGDSLSTYLGSLSGLDRDGWGLGLRLMQHPNLMVLAKGVFAVTTLLELLAPFCLVDDRFRRVWLAVMIPFHISTWFLMDIFFWENLVLAVLLLVDVEAIAARVKTVVGHYPRRRWNTVSPA